MKTKICDINAAAEDLLPPKQSDGSRVGVNYTDAFLKPMNVQLEDGRKIAIKRRGLKLTLSVGDKTGTGLMRRIEHGPDPKAILNEALKEAAKECGVSLRVDGGGIYLEG